MAQRGDDEMKIVRKRKNRVEKAVDILTGYCDKHSDCSYCRFHNKQDLECLFLKGFAPCDWQRARSEENG